MGQRKDGPYSYFDFIRILTSQKLSGVHAGQIMDMQTQITIWKMELMASVKGYQGVLAPPGHLIPPLIEDGIYLPLPICNY
jgi:hypothetical protein